MRPVTLAKLTPTSAPRLAPPRPSIAAKAPLLSPDAPTPKAGEAVRALEGRRSDPSKSPVASLASAMISAKGDPKSAIAKAVTAQLRDAARHELAGRSPENARAVDAMGAELGRYLELTAAELAKDPAALARLEGSLAKLGKEGLRATLKELAPELAAAFTKATGAKAIDPAAAKLALEGLEAAAKKLGPAHADTIAKLGAKLASKEGAKLAVKGGAAAGKLAPGLGNAIAVGSALLAGASLLSACRAEPRDAERVAKEATNALLQTAGVVFPWVALAGDVLDLGWAAKLGLEQRDVARLKSELASVERSLAPGKERDAIGEAVRGFGRVEKALAGDPRAALDALGSAAVARALACA